MTEKLTEEQLSLLIKRTRQELTKVNSSIATVKSEFGMDLMEKALWERPGGLEYKKLVVESYLRGLLVASGEMEAIIPLLNGGELDLRETKIKE